MFVPPWALLNTARIIVQYEDLGTAIAVFTTAIAVVQLLKDLFALANFSSRLRLDIPLKPE